MKQLPARPDYDVLIAGAGPAGSSLAIQLGRAGYSVALVDRTRFPRAKPCGEFLSPPCVPMLEQLGLDSRLLRGTAHEVDGMRLHAHGHGAQGRYRSVGATSAPVIGGLGIRRDVLDARIVDVARRVDAVTVLEEHSVRDVLRDSQGRILGLELRNPEGEDMSLRARMTIGADGLRSRVAQALDVRRPIPWLRRFALVTRYTGVEALPHGELHLIDGGYFAAVDVDGGQFSLNLVVDADVLSKGREGLEACYAERLARAPELADRLAGAERSAPLRAYGPLAVRTTKQIFPGAALVGDACGYVDPMTGEGIFFALRGAELLAAAIAETFEGGSELAALKRYVRARRREIAPKLAFSLLLQRAIRRPALIRHAAQVLERHPGLLDLVVSLTGDYVPIRELFKPRVWFRAWRSACSDQLQVQSP